jgi:hypothetical protein
MVNVAAGRATLSYESDNGESLIETPYLLLRHDGEKLRAERRSFQSQPKC